MYGIVWYQHKKEGQKQFTRIINDYLNNEIELDKIYSRLDKVVFKNGDVWKVLPANDSSRGHRCNVFLIERCIPKDDIHTHIMPATCLRPYSAYEFYGDSEPNEYEVYYFEGE